MVVFNDIASTSSKSEVVYFDATSIKPQIVQEGEKRTYAVIARDKSDKEDGEFETSDIKLIMVDSIGDVSHSYFINYMKSTVYWGVKTTGLATLACARCLRNQAMPLMIRDYQQAVRMARKAFMKGWTRPIEFREEQIKQLIKMIEDNTEELLYTLSKELNMPKFEGMFSDIMVVLNECTCILNNLKSWAKPVKATKNLLNLLSYTATLKEPYGVVLIIAPWCFPVQFSLLPLVGAIGAGNTVIIKPSEVTGTVANFIAKLIPRYLDKNCYHVILGGADRTSELLNERFDHIFYTGNASVARIVHSAANKYLTPVTLELGGKNPLYIDETVDVEAASRLIVNSKFLNVGQTCTAPDYILCKKEVQDKLIVCFEKLLKESYGDIQKVSPYYGRIVSDAHYQRLVKFLSEGTIALGGDHDASERYIAPTILINVKPDATVMQEEIFGPILPIINVKNEVEALEFIRNREHALTIYIYSTSKETQQRFIDWTQSGAITINDSFTYSLNTSLPFGGVGQSGMGKYHGLFSLDNFTHRKSCLISRYDPIINLFNRLRNPPLREKSIDIFKILLKERHWERIWFWLTVLAVLAAMLCGYMFRSWAKGKFFD